MQACARTLFRVRVRVRAPVPRDSERWVNVLMLVPPGFHVSVCLSCPWSVVGWLCPFSSAAGLERSQAPLPTSPQT